MNVPISLHGLPLLPASSYFTTAGQFATISAASRNPVTASAITAGNSHHADIILRLPL